MSHQNEVNSPKRQRRRRSPEMVAELILEAERKGNAAEVCRRENVSPTLFYRWRQKFKEAGIQGLKNLKRGRKPRVDPEKAGMVKEVERLRATVVDLSIELQLLKKSVHSDYMGL